MGSYIMCKTINLYNQKPYFFVSTNSKNPYQNIIKKLNRGKHQNKQLQRDWKKYQFKFEVIEVCEKNTIRSFIQEYSYNAKRHLSDNTRMKISMALGKRHYHHSNKTKNKIRDGVVYNRI